MFRRYVVIVSYECCKSRSKCCICCNGCTHMLQRSVPNVSSVFLDVLLQVYLSGCCIRFTHMSQVFYLDIAYVCNSLQVFLYVFASVLEVCFRCFICLQTYVARVASECFKNRWDVAYVAIRVRSGDDVSGPHTWSGGAGPAWTRETQAQAWIAGASLGVRMWASGWASRR
jgi:hypothetical protein